MSYGLGKSSDGSDALSGYDASAWDSVLAGADYMRGGARSPAPQGPIPGMSLNDFTSGFGIIFGESREDEILEGYAGIGDVIANRQLNPRAYSARSGSIYDVISAPRGRDHHQFDAYGTTRYREGVDLAGLVASNPAGARAGIYGTEAQRILAAMEGVFGERALVVKADKVEATYTTRPATAEEIDAATPKAPQVIRDLAAALERTPDEIFEMLRKL